MLKSRIMRILCAFALAFAMVPASAWAVVSGESSSCTTYDFIGTSGSGECRPDQPDKSDQSDKSNQSDGSDISDNSDQPDNSDQSDDSTKPDTPPDVPDNPDDSNQSNDPTQPNVSPDNSDKIDYKIETYTVTVAVTGVTDHRPGEAFSPEEWVSLSEYVWEVKQYWNEEGQESVKEPEKTAWDVFSHFLIPDKYKYEITDNSDWKTLDSITNLDKKQTLATTSVGNSWSYWEFYLNDKLADQSVFNHKLQNGDKIELRYHDETGPKPEPDINIVPDAPRPSWEADWDGVSGITSNGALEVPSPTTTQSTKLEFAYDYSSEENLYPSAGEPVIVNDRVYLAVDKKLLMLDAQSGNLMKEAKLSSLISYTCRPVYSDGLLIVPLNTGQVQALTADELQTVWLTEKICDLAQSSCSISVDNGCAYVATVDVSYDDATGFGTYSNGTVTCIDIQNGKIKWRHENKDEGYYWNGAAILDDNVVISTSAGTVELLNRSTGQLLNSVRIDSRVNSDCIVDGNGIVYVVSSDGTIHRFKVNAVDNTTSDIAGGITSDITDDTVGDTTSDVCRFEFEELLPIETGLTSSTCTPTIVDNTLIVGGAIDNISGLAIVDLASGQIKLITQSDGVLMSSSMGGIKSAPLVVTQNGETFVYFTNNGAEGSWPTFTAGGGVYCYRMGDDQASLIYDAAGFNNYCDSPVVCDSKGNLYYINDSYHLFKLSNVETPNISGENQGNIGQVGDDVSGSKVASDDWSDFEDSDDAESAERLYSSLPWTRPISMNDASDANSLSKISEYTGDLQSLEQPVKGDVGFVISNETFQKAIDATIYTIMSIGFAGAIISAVYLYRTRRDGGG